MRKTPMSRSRGTRALVRGALLLGCALALATLAAGAAAPPPNLDRAVAAQRALVAQQPTAERYNDLGNLLLLADDVEGAREAYERAIELDETLASAHYNLGLLLQQSGRERNALRHFREVVELSPEHAQAWFQIGVLHEKAGAEGAAVRAYARAYLLDPRLSFSDENPQVLDSRLTTQALLRAQEGLSTASEAPLAYAEPRRIAGLLLPALPEGATPPAAAAEPAAEAEPTAAQTATARRTGTPASRPSPIAPGAAVPGTATAERVLTPQDLDPSSRVGEVTGPAGTRATVTHLPADLDPESTDYSELLRQRLLQQQEQYERTTEDEVFVEGEEAPEVLPDGTFAPDPRSTGQLDYRLEDQLASLPN